MEMISDFEALQEGEKTEVLYNTLLRYLSTQLELLNVNQNKSEYEKRLESELDYILNEGLKPSDSAIRDKKAQMLIERAANNLKKLNPKE